MVLELPVVADPPDVIAVAIGLLIAPLQRSSRDLLAQSDRFQDRAIAEAPAADVVHLACSWRPVEVEERIDEMIESKKNLAERIVGEGEGWISEMSTDELRALVTLRRDMVEQT